MSTWTQDEAIAFEAARECVTDMMSICSEALASEEAKASPDSQRLAELEAQLQQLASEQRALRVSDTERIARIRTQYGAAARADLVRRRAT